VEGVVEMKAHLSSNGSPMRAIQTLGFGCSANLVLPQQFDAIVSKCQKDLVDKANARLQNMQFEWNGMRYKINKFRLHARKNQR
jgi:hypothetical protein